MQKRSAASLFSLLLLAVAFSGCIAGGDGDSVDAAMAASYLLTSNKLNNDSYLPGNYSDWKLSR